MSSTLSAQVRALTMRSSASMRSSVCRYTRMRLELGSHSLRSPSSLSKLSTCAW